VEDKQAERNGHGQGKFGSRQTDRQTNRQTDKQIDVCRSSTLRCEPTQAGYTNEPFLAPSRSGLPLVSRFGPNYTPDLCTSLQATSQTARQTSKQIDRLTVADTLYIDS